MKTFKSSVVFLLITTFFTSNSCKTIKDKPHGADAIPDRNYKWEHPYIPFAASNECVFVDSIKTIFDNASGKIILEFELKNKNGAYYFGGSNKENLNIWCFVADSVNGEVYKIDEFNLSEEILKKQENNAISIVLDHSGSMGERAYFLQDAVAELIQNKRNVDAFSIFKFDTKIIKEVSLLSEKAAILKNFKRNGLEGFNGNTALRDAMDSAINDLAPIKNFTNKLLIVFTDGQDNSSVVSEEKVVADAIKNKVKIFAIDFSKETDPQYMQDVANKTNGKRYMIYQTVEIQNIFEDIYNYLTLTPLKYKLEYTPKEYFGVHYPTFILCFENCNMKTHCPPIENILPESINLNIQFEFDKAIISDTISFIQLDQVAKYLLKNPDIKIKLEGHTDCRGTKEHNTKLAKDRASVVAEALIKRGVSKNRVTAVGIGSEQPHIVTSGDHKKFPFLLNGIMLTCDYIERLVNENEKEVAHALNRRTKMIILK